MHEKPQRVHLYGYPPNRKQTTYEPRTANCPLKHALLSKSAKNPCVPTPTNHAYFGAGSVYAAPNVNWNEFRFVGGTVAGGSFRYVSIVPTDNPSRL